MYSEMALNNIVQCVTSVILAMASAKTTDRHKRSTPLPLEVLVIVFKPSILVWISYPYVYQYAV